MYCVLGDASDCVSNEQGSNAKLKVFRFTATLSDCKREEGTEGKKQDNRTRYNIFADPIQPVKLILNMCRI